MLHGCLGFGRLVIFILVLTSNLIGCDNRPTCTLIASVAEPDQRLVRWSGGGVLAGRLGCVF